MMQATIRMALAIPARLIVLTVCWCALVAWSYGMGYLTFVFEHDVSRLSYVISALLVVAIAAAFAGRKEFLPHVKVWFVTIGLIGNIAGFVIALQGMGQGSLGSPEGMLKMGQGLLDGMGVAFCSTLVGAIAALWTSTMAWVLGMDASE